MPVAQFGANAWLARFGVLFTRRIPAYGRRMISKRLLTPRTWVWSFRRPRYCAEPFRPGGEIIYRYWRRRFPQRAHDTAGKWYRS